MVPVISSEDAAADVGSLHAPAVAPLDYQVPLVSGDRRLPPGSGERVAAYRSLVARPSVNVLVEPGIVQVALPESADELGTWSNLEPLEEGAADFPPNLEDTKLEDRLVAWLRVRAASGAQADLLHVGINAVTVTQRERIVLEPLPEGTGEPDQSVRLAKGPVLPGTATVVVTTAAGPQTWHEIDDLLAAGPEVPVRDPRLPPGTPTPPPTGQSGLRPRRRPRPAAVRRRRPRHAPAARRPDAGQLRRHRGRGRQRRPRRAQQRTGPARGPSASPTRCPTWGGADAESPAEAEKQAARFLQHRDRLVTAADFEAIVRRTPGVELGRVEVLPTFNPQTTPPTQAPGAVTVMVIPRVDALHPQAPEPDRLFLNTICRYLDPRRLVTTEVFLRGPTYVDLWVASVSRSRPASTSPWCTRRSATPYAASSRRWTRTVTTGSSASRSRWGRTWASGPGTAGRSARRCMRLELAAVANRVAGVRLVREVLVAPGTGAAVDQLTVSGLELPRVRAIGVGAEADLDALRGGQPPSPSDLLPVPVVPETC